MEPVLCFRRTYGTRSTVCWKSKFVLIPLELLVISSSFEKLCGEMKVELANEGKISCGVYYRKLFLKLQKSKLLWKTGTSQVTSVLKSFSNILNYASVLMLSFPCTGSFYWACNQIPLSLIS